VSILLGNGARVEIRDNTGKTPLDIIKSRQHTERTQRLLTQYGIELALYIFALTSNIAAGIQISSCALSGQKQRMQQLFTKFNIDVDFCDQNEMKTPLHWAWYSLFSFLSLSTLWLPDFPYSLQNYSMKGSLTCVDYLLNKGATVDVKDKNSETPLFLAVRNGHKDIIEVNFLFIPLSSLSRTL
jgi:ankyrin repeat protein